MSESVREAYTKGRGGVLMRAKMHIEDPNNPATLAGGGNGSSAAAGGKRRGARRSSGGSSKPAVVITELPYQTNKAGLVEQIARLVDAGTITGVADVRDESDRDGMRVVVEVKRGALRTLGVMLCWRFSKSIQPFFHTYIGECSAGARLAAAHPLLHS